MKNSFKTILEQELQNHPNLMDYVRDFEKTNNDCLKIFEAKEDAAKKALTDEDSAKKYFFNGLAVSLYLRALSDPDIKGINTADDFKTKVLSNELLTKVVDEKEGRSIGNTIIKKQDIQDFKKQLTDGTINIETIKQTIDKTDTKSLSNLFNIVLTDLLKRGTTEDEVSKKLSDLYNGTNKAGFEAIIPLNVINQIVSFQDADFEKTFGDIVKIIDAKSPEISGMLKQILPKIGQEQSKETKENANSLDVMMERLITSKGSMVASPGKFKNEITKAQTEAVRNVIIYTILVMIDSIDITDVKNESSVYRLHSQLIKNINEEDQEDSTVYNKFGKNIVGHIAADFRKDNKQLSFGSLAALEDKKVDEYIKNIPHDNLKSLLYKLPYFDKESFDKKLRYLEKNGIKNINIEAVKQNVLKNATAIMKLSFDKVKSSKAAELGQAFGKTLKNAKDIVSKDTTPTKDTSSIGGLAKAITPTTTQSGEK